MMMVPVSPQDHYKTKIQDRREWWQIKNRNACIKIFDASG